jgi:hypothetical protein
VRVEGLEVVDGAGRVRARLGVLHEGGSVFGLGLYDEDGDMRAWLATSPGGPHLVFDEGGDSAVVLGVNDGMDPGDLTGPIFVVAPEDTPPLRLWPDVLGGNVERTEEGEG